MQRKIGWMAAFALSACSLLVAADESSEGQWTFLTDFVYMQRYHVKDQTLAFDPTACGELCPQGVALSTTNLTQSFDFEPGLHVALSYEQDLKSLYEGGFLYVWDWSTTKTRTSDSGSLIFPFQSSSFTEDFYQASKIQAYYKSQFYTGEINYWHAFSASRESFLSISGVGGIRYAHVDETFALTAFKGSESGNYDISTKNDLIGVQVGFCFEINAMKTLHWDLGGKVGVGLNRMSSDAFLADQNRTIEIRSFNKQDFQSNIFAEALAGFGYRALPWLDLHAGYQMLYFCGLALAPDQLDTSARTIDFQMYRNGYVIVHGIYAGLLFSF